jgi:hypothetical protein
MYAATADLRDLEPVARSNAVSNGTSSQNRDTAAVAGCDCMNTRLGLASGRITTKMMEFKPLRNHLLGLQDPWNSRKEWTLK